MDNVIIKNSKIKWSFSLFFILLICCIAILTHVYTYKEENENNREILNRGYHLASLISLYPVMDKDTDERNFFLRTLNEYFTSRNLAYYIVQDLEGHSLITLSPDNIASKVPDEIRSKSLQTKGLINQSFHIKDLNQSVHEFAKPIFRDGKRSGTVRLGLLTSEASFLSRKNISYMGVLALFALVPMVLTYYGAAFVLYPIRNLYRNIGNGDPEGSKQSMNSNGTPGFIPAIEDLEQSLQRLKDTLNSMESDNMNITTKLGVVTYEKNRISRVIDSIETAVILTDVHENIIYINSSMLNLLDKRRNEVLNHPVEEILPDDEIKSFLSSRDSTREVIKKNSIEVTFPETAPDKTFQLSVTRSKEEEGIVSYNLISIRDITEIKVLKENSHGFIAHVAHELITPLTTIRSYNEMLMDGEVEDKEMQKEFYNTISEETGRLSKLIQNLLSIAKLEIGSMVMEKGLVKSDWVVEDSIAAVEGSALKKNIMIYKKMPDIFPNLVGDKEMLKIAIINILGNAVKYSPENTTITLSLLERNSEVIFIVEDKGHGISQEDLPHIFEKFYRSDNPNIQEQVGSGLGLAMTAEIVNLHGGEIEVNSEPGKGSQFIIRLPKEQYYVGEQ